MILQVTKFLLEPNKPNLGQANEAINGPILTKSSLIFHLASLRPSLVHLPAFRVAPDQLVTPQWKGATGMQAIGSNLF